MDQDAQVQARWLALDGPVNFRDLGGYPTDAGGSVRTGLVYRADSLHTMSDRDVDLVVRAVGIETVIDLRTAGEVELIGVGPIRDAGIRWHNISIFDETQRTEPRLPGAETPVDSQDIVERSMAQEYLDMLERTGPQFATVLELLAATARPVVFHCAAGKDRTGLVAALLLDLLGVGDHNIAADYALTERVMPTLRERFLERVRNPRLEVLYGPPSQWEPRMNRAMASDPATIRHVLDDLRARHGSVAGWLTGCGLPTSAIDSLRTRLAG